MSNRNQMLYEATFCLLAFAEIKACFKDYTVFDNSY